jgi:hypothetical protein
MKKLALPFLIICSNLYSQNIKCKLFDTLNTFQYKAVFINKNGDTLSKEKILLNAITEGGLLKVTYFTTDSILNHFRNIKNRKNESKKIQRVNEEYTSNPQTNDEFWIHPFRANQYAYAEVAPFPEARIQKLKIGETWKGGAFILSGWGNLKGRMRNLYQVMDNEQFSLMDQIIKDCWHIKGIGKHNRLGISTINYLYHKEYGFLLMNYECFDSTRIIFSLERIDTKKK